MRDHTKVRVYVILGLGVPLLFVNARWGMPVFIAYSLTAVFFGVLMIGEWPPFGTQWFWRTIPIIVLFHAGIVTGLISLDLYVPRIHSLPLIAYGFLALIAMVEWKIALRILGLGRPDEE